MNLISHHHQQRFNQTNSTTQYVMMHPWLVRRWYFQVSIPEFLNARKYGCLQQTDIYVYVYVAKLGYVDFARVSDLEWITPLDFCGLNIVRNMWDELATHSGCTLAYAHRVKLDLAPVSPATP